MNEQKALLTLVVVVALLTSIFIIIFGYKATLDNFEFAEEVKTWDSGITTPEECYFNGYIMMFFTIACSACIFSLAIITIKYELLNSCNKTERKDQ